MPLRLDRLDRALGRAVFRAFGVMFGLVSAVCLYAAYRYATDWHDGSPATAALFGVIGAAFGGIVPFCFSRKRRLSEALDSMQDETPALPRRPKT